MAEADSRNWRAQAAATTAAGPPFSLQLAGEVALAAGYPAIVLIPPAPGEGAVLRVDVSPIQFAGAAAQGADDATEWYKVGLSLEEMEGADYREVVVTYEDRVIALVDVETADS